jgi:FixJ family two-component response regulator
VLDAHSTSVIAIVDDDPDVRGSLNSLFRSAGLASVAFGSAEDLLADDPTRFSWIITDLHMPGMTGLELQTEVCRRGIHVAIILMTAFPTHASEEQAIAAGARAFMAKPIDPDILLETIEAA